MPSGLAAMRRACRLAHDLLLGLAGVIGGVRPAGPVGGVAPAGVIGGVRPAGPGGGVGPAGAVGGASCARVTADPPNGARATLGGDRAGWLPRCPAATHPSEALSPRRPTCFAAARSTPQGIREPASPHGTTHSAGHQEGAIERITVGLLLKQRAHNGDAGTCAVAIQAPLLESEQGARPGRSGSLATC
jgi:hypothetical protein